MDKKDFTILLVCTFIAAFLGSLLAIKHVLSPYRYPYHPHHHFMSSNMEPFMRHDFDYPKEFIEYHKKMMENFDDDVQPLLKRKMKNANLFLFSNTGVKTQETDNMYKITFDMKPFNNNPKNVIIESEDDSITISAKYKSKKGNEIKSAQFFQEIEFPTDIKQNEIKKQYKGDSLIITVPKLLKSQD